MILADGIDLPLVMVLGIAAFGPLTLLVTLIESLILRSLLDLNLRAVFIPVLVANLLSTLAGSILLAFQDGLLSSAGLFSSIPAFVHGYTWMGPLLVAAYFLKSVLVECLWLARPRILERLRARRSNILRGVLLGNVASYLVVGPIFYYTTRPTFGGLEPAFDTRWTHNSDVVAYYIDPKDQFIKRLRLNGEQPATLVPHPAWSFVVSADESTVVYTKEEGNLYLHRVGQDDSILIDQSADGWFMSSVSLSHDNQRIAYLSQGGDWFSAQASTLKVFDCTSKETVKIGIVPDRYWGTPVAWSSDGRTIVARTSKPEGMTGVDNIPPRGAGVRIFDAEPPHEFRDDSISPPSSALVENYVRNRGDAHLRNSVPTIALPRRGQAGDCAFETWPYLGSAIVIQTNGRPALTIANDYGLLNLSLPPFEDVIFLPSGDELLLDWGRKLHLVSLIDNRIGMVTGGYHYVLRTPEFRISFDEPPE